MIGSLSWSMHDSNLNYNENILIFRTKNLLIIQHLAIKNILNLFKKKKKIVTGQQIYIYLLFFFFCKLYNC